MSKLWKAMCMISVFLFLFPQSAYANGGTGEGYALLTGGNIKFENTPDIFVEKEDSILFCPRGHRP